MTYAMTSYVVNLVVVPVDVDLNYEKDIILSRCFESFMLASGSIFFYFTYSDLAFVSCDNHFLLAFFFRICFLFRGKRKNDEVMS